MIPVSISLSALAQIRTQFDAGRLLHTKYCILAHILPEHSMTEEALTMYWKQRFSSKHRDLLLPLVFSIYIIKKNYNLFSDRKDMGWYGI